MSVIELLKNELNACSEMTTTENGDYAYISSGNANLDFFGLAGASRHDQMQVVNLFQKALAEDTTLALKNILYLRDIRGGLGERDSFRSCFQYLCENASELATALFPLVIKYGRFDDLFLAKGTLAEDAMLDFINAQLKEDIINYESDRPYSLLSKWLPSINASSKSGLRMANFFASRLGYSKAEYRKILSRLRKGKIIENYLREKDYSFAYESIPAKALSKYRSAFERNDSKRYQRFIHLALTNPSAIKVNTLFPYDIIREYSYNMNDIQKDAMQAKWNALEPHKETGNTIVVRDGSGSMNCFQNGLPLLIATSLAILFAEQLKGEFANHFITFSSSPKLVHLPTNWNLHQKLMHCYTFNDYTNTDISRVYNLIYQTSLKIKDPKDYIQRIVIISDMEFDKGTDKIPTYETMKKRFEQAAIPLPEIIYWNVCARHPHFAARADQPNIRFVSGASQHVIKAIINNETVDAVEMMKKVLERYEVEGHPNTLN
ncbi:DUF2828 family protein [Clostridiales bacterium COT073_COT-073]|nr:DUF2828 family protein [Clostridiales bacterium COT073_COT-073]